MDEIEFGGAEWSAKIWCGKLRDGLEREGISITDFITRYMDIDREGVWVLFAFKDAVIVGEITRLRRAVSNILYFSVKGVRIEEHDVSHVECDMLVSLDKPVAKRVAEFIETCGGISGYVADIRFASCDDEVLVMEH